MHNIHHILIILLNFYLFKLSDNILLYSLNSLIYLFISFDKTQILSFFQNFSHSYNQFICLFSLENSTYNELFYISFILKFISIHLFIL